MPKDCKISQLRWEWTVFAVSSYMVLPAGTYVGSPSLVTCRVFPFTVEPSLSLLELPQRFELTVWPRLAGFTFLHELFPLLDYQHYTLL